MSKPKKTITEFRSYYLPVEFPVLVLTGEHWRISDKPNEHLHFHNCLELGYCHEGSGILKVRKQNIPFSGDDITFIARNIPHTTWSASGSSSKWSYIMVDMTEMLDSFAPGSSYPISQMLESINTARIIHKQDNPVLAFYVNRLIQEIVDTKPQYQLNSRALFLSLLIELCRYCGENHQQAPQIVPDKLEQNHTLAIVPALEYIKHNYMNQFTMESLADLCGLSPTHFRRVFNTTMGGSPLEYLNTVRITKACYLLRSTEESVLNISESVGFHSISSFNRYFYRLVNMSPREYRRSSIDDKNLQNARIMKFNGWMEPDL
ncbi:MAG: helix-turn-helix transcriptional regulator [Lachnospiraceae bacterium]|nr:helix-turn-helix transcriptional regulator [Lachnospiraceae bacterium]